MKKMITSALLIVILAVNSFPQFSTIHSFNGSEGYMPFGKLYSDGVFLYGTSYAGGTNGLGSVYKTYPDGTGMTSLHSFDGSIDGSNPYFGALIYDGIYLYGMASTGGVNNKGTIFRIKPDGTSFLKIFDFDGSTSGNQPMGSLFFDGTDLFGMTKSGGANNLGTLFKIKPDGTGYSTLVDFDGITTGSGPEGSLVSDGTFLYGATLTGGTSDMGVLFKLLPTGSGFVKLLDFDGTPTGRFAGTPIFDGTYLYGMTRIGGTYDDGTIYKILPDGTGYVKLMDFNDALSNTGRNPYGSLTIGGSYLYGSAAYGGVNDEGAIFKIMPDGSGYQNIFDFDIIPNGNFPFGSVSSDGYFIYGTTSEGTATNGGTIFKYQFAGMNVENNSPMNIQAFPNPVADVLNLTFSENKENIQLIILNSLGQEVYSLKLNYIYPNKNYSFDLSNLNPGIYYLDIEKARLQIIKK
jgi:uncharacterized repeat protein (TIGR03803 family)